MISHPFEIAPSANNQDPDVLMVTWRGTPAQSVAEIYLPAVSAKTIVTLAGKLYGRHRLTASDANTIQFPAVDMALIPVPAGTGRYAGLLSVEPHPSLPEGRSLTVSVRQLNQVSATGRTPPSPPPPPVIQVAEANRDSERNGKDTFSWHRLGGAFQYTVTSQSPKHLLPGQEQLVAWLKWRIGVTPPSNRWLPVLQRYLTYTESLVWNLGTDPNRIPPSENGSINGPGPIVIHEEHEVTGKVTAIEHDRFGDFRGFVILTEAGAEHAFRATEHAIETLVRDAWVERTVVRVFFDAHHRERVDRLVLLRYR
jgi:hypothetical protein